MKKTPQSNRLSSAEKPINWANTAKLKSEEIFKDQRDVIIEHAGDEYHLRLTKLNKLILTK